MEVPEIVVENQTVSSEPPIKRLRQFHDPTQSRENRWDRIVIVDGKKFHVLAAHLAMHADFFDRLFFKDFAEKDKEEVTLNDFDADDFQNFLETINGELCINDENITGIMALSDYLGAPTAMNRCEHFLLNETKKDIFERYYLSEMFKIDNLKSKTIQSIKTFKELKEVVRGDVMELDHPTLRLISQMEDWPLLAEIVLRSFDDIPSNRWDKILVVGDKKFYVLGAHLANHSSFFDNLFFKDPVESQKTEHILEGDSVAVQKLLEVINGENVINEDSVQGILELALQWEVSTAVTNCERYLTNKSEMPFDEKWNLAMKLDFKPLKVSVIAALKSSDELQAILPSDPSHQLDKFTMAILLEKILEFHEPPPERFTIYLTDAPRERSEPYIPDPRYDYYTEENGMIRSPQLPYHLWYADQPE
uniref:BTB domain-containing protein n=1 Tax=Caenorhabditis tropicalis TaxID=1561998 RepID=A0A1I7TCL0_9PELO